MWGKHRWTMNTCYKGPVRSEAWWHHVIKRHSNMWFFKFVCLFYTFTRCNQLPWCILRPLYFLIFSSKFPLYLTDTIYVQSLATSISSVQEQKLIFVKSRSLRFGIHIREELKWMRHVLCWTKHNSPQRGINNLINLTIHQTNILLLVCTFLLQNGAL